MNLNPRLRLQVGPEKVDSGADWRADLVVPARAGVIDDLVQLIVPRTGAGEATACRPSPFSGMIQVHLPSDLNLFDAGNDLTPARTPSPSSGSERAGLR